MRRRRILYVTHDFPPEAVAGTELNALHLARQLSRRYDIHVFAGTRHPSLQDYSVATEQRYGLRITRIKIPPLNAVHPADIYLNRRIEDAFDTFLDQTKPSLIHFHHLLGLSVGMIERAVARRIPTLLHIRDFYYFCPRIFLKDSDDQFCRGPVDRSRCAECVRAGQVVHIPKVLASTCTPQAFAETLESTLEYVKRLLLLSNVMICPSRFIKRELVRFGLQASKIKVHPDGVRELPRIEHRLSDSKVSFGFLGSLSHIKGTDVLLDAFSRLDQSKAELLLFGEGDPAYLEGVKSQHRPLRIEFGGRYSQEDLPRILSRLDVLVHPSVCHESYSLVVHEALAAGVPVLVSDISAQRDDIKNGINGLTFKVGDSGDLKRKMEKVIESPRLLHKLRKWHTKVATVREQAGQMEVIYERLLRKGARSSKRTLDDLREVRVLIEHDRKWLNLTEELTQAKLDIAQLRSTVQERESTIQRISEESTRSTFELQEIRSSLGYKFMKFYASGIDRLFPDGTTRGELRKIVVTSLRVITENGIRSFAAQAMEKIRRREFRIVNTLGERSVHRTLGHELPVTTGVALERRTEPDPSE